jgi:hypothetical protein
MSERSNSPGLVLGSEPRVDLLPPEVHERVRLAKVRRVLAVFVVLALVLAIGGYGVASIYAGSAEASLAKSNSVTVQILQARQKYSAASRIADQVTAIQAAQKQAASTEVLWAALYKKISALLPADAHISGGDFKTPAPGDPPLALSGPLRLAHVASLTLRITGGSVPEAAAVLDRLSTLPGYADATLDSVTYTSGNYVSSFTIDLSDKALSGRFATSGATQ